LGRITSPHSDTVRPLNAELPELVAPLGRISILVTSHHPVVCGGLGALVGAQPDFRVIGEASNAVAALRLARELRPEIILIDLIDLPLSGVSHADLIRDLSGSAQLRTCRIIVLTGAIQKMEVVRLLRSGARGIVLKDSPVELVFKCIRTVRAGEVWISRGMMADVVQALASSTDDEEPSITRDFRLTRRERDILKLVLDAETNKGIAERLSVTEDTVKHHLTNIFDKTGASNRLELALFAVHHGLI
jgi:two-component system, NarL family, nitrate/nitrite response regulator NarL